MSDLLWDRWDDVDRIFEQALDVAVEDRPRFVEEACAGDPELLDTVSRLLRATEDEDDALLSGPSSSFLEQVFVDRRILPPRGRDLGLEIGPWRTVREVGRGGTAVVYEAERVDGAFEQRVAVKILGGVDSEDLVRRFLDERRILSSLSHPDIAGILDGGATEDGRPWLAMEFIEGEPITRWADRQRLGIRERVALFRQVVDAVAYAHTRLVVHRDLKPSNVLVDAEGRVRLLDFGIAKLLEAPEGGSPGTRPATRWMTPEYAAPEQILGRPVTTATDVHGLGVLLYELLAGRRPWDGVETGTGFALGRAICEEPPSAVSDGALSGGDPARVADARGTTPERLRTALAGDVDAIVDKALRKDPEERYASAREMGDDLDRHLNGHPVAAREGLWGYRARKFVLRHRVGVGAVAAVLATLLVSGGLLVRAQAETARQRDRAATEAENGRLVIEFLADVFRGRDPTEAPPDTVTARELLAWGTERVESEFADRPAVRAELLSVLGRAHGNVGMYEEGQELLARAVELEREVHGETSPEVADALLELGTLRRLGRDFEVAVPPLREAVRLLDETGAGGDARMADALEGLAMALRDTGKPDSAEVLLRRALAARERTPGDERATVETTLTLAYVLRGLDRLDEAERLYEAGIPRFRALPDHDRGQLATYLNNLAYLRRVRGDAAGAEPLYREAWEIGRDYWGDGHPSTLNMAANLASALELQGRLDETVQVLRARVQAVRAQWPEGHWRVAAAQVALTDALLMRGDVEEAEAVGREAAAEYTETLGEQHDWTSFAWARVGVARILVGDTVPGRMVLDRLHAWLAREKERGGGPVSRDTRMLVEPFVRVLERVGLDGEAERYRGLIAEDTGGR